MRKCAKMCKKLIKVWESVQKADKSMRKCAKSLEGNWELGKVHISVSLAVLFIQSRTHFFECSTKVYLPFFLGERSVIILPYEEKIHLIYIYLKSKQSEQSEKVCENLRKQFKTWESSSKLEKAVQNLRKQFKTWESSSKLEKAVQNLRKSVTTWEVHQNLRK